MIAGESFWQLLNFFFTGLLNINQLVPKLDIMKANICYQDKCEANILVLFLFLTSWLVYSTNSLYISQPPSA